MMSSMNDGARAGETKRDLDVKIDRLSGDFKRYVDKSVDDLRHELKNHIYTNEIALIKRHADIEQRIQELDARICFNRDMILAFVAVSIIVHIIVGVLL